MKVGGFTLVELMVTLGVTGIAMTVILTGVGGIFRGYEKQLSGVHALENGRTAMRVIRQHLQNAGYGFSMYGNSAGFFPLGQCWRSSNTESCNNIDEIPVSSGLFHDRLRVLYGRADGLDFFRESCGVTSSSEIKVFNYASTTPVLNDQGEKFAILSGECVVAAAGKDSSTVLMKLTSESAQGESQSGPTVDCSTGPGGLGCSCLDDSDCTTSGQRCRADYNYCTKACSSKGDCAPGQLCEDGECFFGCDDPSNIKRAHRIYGYTPYTDAKMSEGDTCVGASYQNFNLLMAELVDFRIQQSNGFPVLKMVKNILAKEESNNRFSWDTDAVTVASGIETLQVRYGLDLGVDGNCAAQGNETDCKKYRNCSWDTTKGCSSSENATGNYEVDCWCDDPIDLSTCFRKDCADTTIDCQSITGLDNAAKLSRVVAAKVGIIARSRLPLNKEATEDLVPLPRRLFPKRCDGEPDGSVVVSNIHDGYTRWVFYSTVGLRNRR